MLTGPAPFFCPTSGRTLVMGFHPLFILNCGRRTGVLRRTFGSASGEARSTFRWSLFHFSWDLLLSGFTCRQEELDLARHSRRPLKSGLHRIGDELSRNGRPAGSNCVCRNSFSRRAKPAPLIQVRQHETAAETTCEVARARALLGRKFRHLRRVPCSARGKEKRSR
jgi:hypothetical protein